MNAQLVADLRRSAGDAGLSMREQRRLMTEAAARLEFLEALVVKQQKIIRDPVTP